MNTRNLRISALVALGLGLASPTPAATNIDGLLRHYAAQGGKEFDAQRGRAFWSRDHASDKGETLNCGACHGTALDKPGRHRTSGKVIEPMAPSVNRERYTDLEKVEKWFTRNCKQVLARECTAQEKGDVLRYLSGF